MVKFCPARFITNQKVAITLSNFVEQNCETMTKDRKDTITVWSAIAMLAFGVALTATAFCINPVGEIHDSVLWTLGQCLLYAGGALGIANYAKASAREAVEEQVRMFKATKEMNANDSETEKDG